MAEEKEKKKEGVGQQQQQATGAKRTTVDKWKRKKWFKILAPKEFDNKEVAETPADKDKNVIGRTIDVNLWEITGDRQKRHITVTFKVKEIKGQQGITEIVKHEISPIHINRMVRRHTSKIEAVQLLTTKDNKKIRVKTVALSQKKLNKRQETAIRNMIIKGIDRGSKGKDFTQLIQLIVFGVLASKLFKDLKKIAPLKRVETVKSVVLEG